MRQARAETDSPLSFARKFLAVIVSTVGCLVITALLLAVPIAMVVIGSLYVNDCPLQRYIPIYLIVGGVFGLLKNLSSLAHQAKNKRNDNEEDNAKSNPFDGLVACFLLGWFIAGNVWVFGAEPDLNTTQTNSTFYCEPTCFYFAFWQIISVYILFGLIFCAMCSLGCAFALCVKCSGKNDAACSRA